MTDKLYNDIVKLRKKIEKAYKALPANYAPGNKKLYDNVYRALGELIFIER